MMHQQVGKRIVEGTLSLKEEPKRRCMEKEIDYYKCIICQGPDTKELYNVTSTDKLVLAMMARQDDTFDRLRHDSATDTWLKDTIPKWHAKCRNLYTNKKSYTLAEKKRIGSSDAQNLQSTECSTSSQRPTRTNTPKFIAKKACVICNKRWVRGKEPTCRVSTKISQETIIDKATELNREDVLLRLIGKGHDMVANDISYHRPCMNAFKACRVPSGKSKKQNLYDVAFAKLVDQLETPLFHDMCGFLVKALRDQYRAILRDLGVKTADLYRSNTLKLRLQQKYGKQISFIDQSHGSGFICASSIPLGDALEKLRHIEAAQQEDEKYRILRQAAKIIRADCKQCKQQYKHEQSIEISFAAAAKLIPDSLFNFTAILLSETPVKLQECGRVLVNQSTTEKVLVASQQLLQHIACVPTPLAIATAYHVFNQTRSKSLIMLNNKLGNGISYERLQRQLTAKSASIMEKVEEDGVYIPEDMVEGTLHVFAVDNLDWKKKTLEGGSFHATTAIIIENPVTTNRSYNRGEVAKLSVPISGSQKTLTDVPNTSIPMCHISTKERQRSRSLSSIKDVGSLATPSDNTAEALLLLWRLGRMAPASQLLDVESQEILPGFSAFCARLLPHNDASKIGYLPLIPASPTDPTVLKEEMARLVKTSHALGDRWTIITGDQATYELAFVIRDKHQQEFSNVVLLLGGFHQAHNYVKAICKIIRDSGAAEHLVTAGLCQEGTAKKMFGEKADYYQTMHAIRILSEAMWRVYWEAFEIWVAEKDTSQWQHSIEDLVQKLLENNTAATEKLAMIQNSQQQLAHLQHQMQEFQKSLDGFPTAIFWCNFLDMTDILHRFIYHQREGNWMGHLCESAKMLPYLTAAGHYKYGQQSLPLYLSEMKTLPETAPEVHMALMKGAFVGRRAAGTHNAVSPDMLLEQTYNADAKEESGLDGITLNEAARTKWVYTKPVTAAISAELKSMLHLNTSNPHHESGQTRIARDGELVKRVTAAIETNPFSSSMSALINISTGQHADAAVQEHLTGVKELGLKALSNSISSDQTKTSIVKLKTFHTQNAKPQKSTRNNATGKSDEVIALLRITQIIASGGEIDVVNFIGNHECSKVPLSLFNEDGTMRAGGTKASLVKALKVETHVTSVDVLPPEHRKTAVVVDAMHAIHHWSFKKDDTFGNIAVRYKKQLLKDVPAGTEIIHFCCDRYSERSLKSAEHQHRYVNSKPAKVFEVGEQYRAPDPQEFFSVSANKAALLRFLCETWSKPEQETPALGSTRLYLGGGFKEETKCMLLTEGSATDISALESTQQEADTRVVLHAIYSVQNEHVDRVVIHGNDTDIIIICTYYAASILKDLPELWIRTAAETYLPIHQMAIALGPSKCRALPFIHSLSGRDTTSYPYFTGKKTWLSSGYTTDITEIENFGEQDQDNEITTDLIDQARQLTIAVYTNKSDNFEDCDLGRLRAHKFLNSRSTLLKLLPPTEDAFRLHLKRAALATIIDKTAHVAKPQIPPFVDYGWAVEDGRLSPIMSEKSVWPQTMTKAISCSCIKGCNRNCSCARKNVSCYIGCRCQGSATKCSRVKYTAAFEADDSSDCSDIENESDN